MMDEQTYDAMWDPAPGCDALSGVVSVVARAVCGVGDDPTNLECWTRCDYNDPLRHRRVTPDDCVLTYLGCAGMIGTDVDGNPVLMAWPQISTGHARCLHAAERVAARDLAAHGIDTP